MKQKQKEQKSITLHCFSPEVMLATFIIEFALAIYVFVKSRINKSGVGIVLTLLFLGIFQLAEYQICRGADSLMWSRIGLFVITFLPVFGYFLVSRIKGDTQFLKVGFLSAMALAVFWVFVPTSITGAACGGNYVILNMQPALYQFFGYYYFGFLLLGIWKALEGIKENPKKVLTRKALFWVIVGYLSFILPLTLVYMFLAGTRVGVASIMCGFAIIFAFILTFKIAPIYHDCVKTGKEKEKPCKEVKS